MLHRNTTLAALAFVTCVTFAGAQGSPTSEVGPKVGDVAPDFTLPTATKAGASGTVSLSQYRGKTIVLAFFPRARTSGCVAQMTKFRDQWAKLFNGVQVISISTDADTTLANWARESNFPMQFGSDAKGEAGTKYGAYNAERRMDNRLLYVVGPDGRITYTAKPFRPLSEDAYTDLGAALRKTTGAP